MTDTTTSHTTPTTVPTASSSAAAPQAAATPHTHATPATQAETQAGTEPPVDAHKKHGIGAIVDKIIHPHGSSHTHPHTDAHAHPDAVSVPVAVPQAPSDGPAHLAPGGSAVGGIL